jgi:hypothetical protein
MEDAPVLATWNDGPSEQAIVDFVISATTRGPGIVDVPDRIATFDRDGTLSCEIVEDGRTYLGSQCSRQQRQKGSTRNL